MTAARILFAILLVDASVCAGHVNYGVYLALLAIVGSLAWTLGRWHERDCRVERTHDVTQTLSSVLRSRR